MKKSSLKDIKKRNRQMIVQAVIDEVYLSRIEIAQNTGLSPSTVTTLVSELMEDNVLVETGEAASTGGRRRKELAVNPDYGIIAVVEVGRAKAGINLFDMLLHKVDESEISVGNISGNSLLIEITAAIVRFLRDGGLRQGHLAGIGLLFQDDMSESDFSVMYSTSLSSDVISLREALYTQFRVPVIEEYSQVYSVTEALNLAGGNQNAKNSAHISVANSVLVSVTVDGKLLPMKNGKSANLTALVQGFEGMIPEFADEDGSDPEPPSTAAHALGLAGRIAALIAVLCGMFSLDVVFLSGRRAKASGFIRAVECALGQIMSAERPPIEAMKPSKDEIADLMAAKIRRNILLAQ